MIGKIVRCKDGHLYRENAVLNHLFRSVHLGLSRSYERCRVDGNWGLVRAVDPATLTPDEIRQADLVA